MANSDPPGPDPEIIDHDDPHVARALTSLAECALALDTSPSISEYTDWRDDRDDKVAYPSAGYITTHCGSWNAAKRRLGLPTATTDNRTYDDLDDDDVDWRWDDLDGDDGPGLDDLAMRAWFCATVLTRATRL